MNIRFKFNISRIIGAILERIKYIFIKDVNINKFYIVSCQRNSGIAAIKCLDSVYKQKYLHEYLHHIFVDDASEDNTDQLVREWLKNHPDNSVTFMSRKKRIGETANNIWAIRQVPDDAIVMIVDGDDWLSGNNSISFLNKVYNSGKVWMTYNSLRIRSKCVADMSIPYPAEIVKNNLFRSYEWRCGAPRSFRRKLFDYVNIQSLIDSETGRFYENSYDMALFLSMLELSGEYSRHIYKVMYIYNVREYSHAVFEPELLAKTGERIRNSCKYEKIDTL
jgi:glycosyltransferase involved in cell wall biosynthesis